MKIRLLAVLALILALSCVWMASCGEEPVNPATSSGAAEQSSGASDIPVHSGDNEDEDSDGIGGVTTSVQLNGAKVTVDGEGAAFDASARRISITKAGTYTFSGVLEDGQIYVNVAKEEKVALVMNGVKISCSDSAPIYGDSSDKIYIILNEGTTNTFEDAVNYVYPDATSNSPNACIFSDDDLSIKGTGTLSVVGKFKNGISSKNDVKIAEANVIVNAVNTGIRGKDSVKIESGNVSVIAGKDGLKATSTEEGRGYILISGGAVNISCEDDALQAESDITLDQCKVTVSCAGKKTNCAGTEHIGDGCLIEK